MHKFVVCLSNKNYEVSLEQKKLYEVLPDENAKKMGQIRIIDETGEDYLFPEELFVDVTLSEDIADRVAKIA